MPGTMMHLLTAKKVKPQGSKLFFLGNITPDAPETRQKKDKTHFRDMSEQDRRLALISLAKKTDGDFAEGILLHLYTDWKWDTTILQNYIDTYPGPNWFPQYRDELGIAGRYAFHNTPWAKQLWDDLAATEIESYGHTPGVSAIAARDFVFSREIWHNEKTSPPSTAFTPELVETFVSENAAEYSKWRQCTLVSRIF